MIEVEIGLAAAFVAGLITFLAPCTLPLVPAYLGFISGVDTKDLEDPAKAKAARKKIFLNGLFFIVGFTLVFIIFGALFGLIGQGLVPYRLWLGRIGGVFVILFGLLMLGVFKIRALQVDKRIKTPSWIKVGKPSSSLIIGGAFSLGWTPCVGPILASILLLAGTQGSVGSGTLLLLAFSLGLAVPFLLVALAFSSATKYITKISKWLKYISAIGGIFLIILGFFLITDSFGKVIQYGFEFFQFLGFDKAEETLLQFL